MSDECDSSTILAGHKNHTYKFHIELSCTENGASSNGTKLNSSLATSMNWKCCIHYRCRSFTGPNCLNIHYQNRQALPPNCWQYFYSLTWGYNQKTEEETAHTVYRQNSQKLQSIKFSTSNHISVFIAAVLVPMASIMSP
jgi:hypothetical protein